MHREGALKKSPLPPAPPAEPASPYEAPGRLAAADRPVLGVAVPRIARVLSESDDQALIEVSGVPYEAVERFFTRLLDTGRVEQASAGPRILDATPRPPGNPRRRVDVLLRSSPRSTVISVFDHTPVTRRSPPTEEEARFGRGAAVDYTKRVPGVTE